MRQSGQMSQFIKPCTCSVRPPEKSTQKKRKEKRKKVWTVCREISEECMVSVPYFMLGLRRRIQYEARENTDGVMIVKLS